MSHENVQIWAWVKDVFPQVRSQHFYLYAIPWGDTGFPYSSEQVSESLHTCSVCGPCGGLDTTQASRSHELPRHTLKHIDFLPLGTIAHLSWQRIWGHKMKPLPRNTDIGDNFIIPHLSRLTTCSYREITHSIDIFQQSRQWISARGYTLHMQTTNLALVCTQLYIRGSKAKKPNVEIKLNSWDSSVFESA